MAVIVEQLKPSSKKDSRSSKNKNNNNNNHQQKLSRANLLEAISKGGKITSYTVEDGSVKMKILVKKQDLKQILGGKNNVGVRDRHQKVSYPAQTPSSDIERRLFDLMRRKKVNAQAKGAHHHLSSWTPKLQSIPEEH